MPSGELSHGVRRADGSQAGIVEFVLAWIAVASVVMFVGSLVAIPWFIVRLPADYFDVRVPRHWMIDRHPALRAVGHGAKNLAGLVIIVLGLIMALPGVPGQGVLTILIGLSLVDFPGKRRLEVRLVGQPAVLKALNAIRHRFGRPPLVLAPEP
jgi:hypothetical protein